MAESTKVLSSRMVQKHDIEANWLKATTFIPKLGEIIVYDIDENYDYERFKIGDGQTIVGSLPFAVDDHCGIVRKEGKVAFAKSLEGLTIGVTSNINFIQSGEGDASADNVRPITGWDTVSVTRTGKNVFGGMGLVQSILSQAPTATLNEEAKTIMYTVGQISGKTLFDRFKSGKKYTVILKRDEELSKGLTANLRLVYANGEGITPKFTEYGNPMVVPSASDMSRLLGVNMTGPTYLYYDECGVFEGVVTLDDFVPYEGVTLTAELPETVYGGMLNWNTGVLTVTHDCIESYAGEEVPEGWISSVGALTEGAQVVYPLDTPYTIQLAPQQLMAVDGINNVWSNCGDTIAIFNSPMVTSINGKVGAITLTANDIGALPDTTEIPSVEGLATEVYVDNKINSLIDAAPEALNTLNELSTALGDDPNFATTVLTQIGNKVNKEEGKGLSTNDFTTEEKEKLASLEKVEYYGLIREEGEIVSAESLEGLAILPVSKISYNVESNGEDASPTNPHKFTGWDAIELHHETRNIFGGSALAKTILDKVDTATIDENEGIITYSGTGISTRIIYEGPFEPNTQYTIFMTPDDSNTASTPNMRVVYTDNKNPTTLGFFPTVTSKDKTVKYIVGYNNSGTTKLSYNKCGIIKGVLEQDDFSPYGETRTVNLGETIYEGAFDWNTGELTVFKVAKILDGTENFTTQTAPEGCTGFIFKASLAASWKNDKSIQQRIKCTHGVDALSGTTGTVKNAVSFNSSRINLLMNMDSSVCGTTVDEFKAYLAQQYANGTPFTVVYSIVPRTIQLSPYKLLSGNGTNTLYSNCGDTIATFNVASNIKVDDTLTLPGMASDAKITGDALDKINALIGDATQLATANKTTLVDAINEVAVGGELSGLVRYDEAQSLTEEEKAQARTNIGISDTGTDLTGMVLYNAAQPLTDTEKAQARSNIGALAEENILEIIDDDMNNTEGDSETVWSSQKSQNRLEAIESTVDDVADNYSLLATNMGSIDLLETTDKSNVVAAINEIKAQVENSASIDDTIISDSTIWSSSKVDFEIEERKAYTDGDPDINSYNYWTNGVQLTDKASFNISNDYTISCGEGQANPYYVFAVPVEDNAEYVFRYPQTLNGQTTVYQQTVAGYAFSASAPVNMGSYITYENVGEYKIGHHKYDIAVPKGAKYILMFFSSVFTGSLNGNDLRLQKRIIELKPHINVRKSSIYADDALNIEAWGDSLTYGTGVSNYDYTKAYPAVLSSLTGYNVLNYGVGGETIETILGRMGAYPIMVCPAVGGTITIPADSNTAVSINLKSITGTDATPLLQSANAEKGVNPCSINNVLGTLTYNSASGGYTFQRLTSGSEITISSPVPLVTKYMQNENNNRVRLLWIGQNNAADQTLNNNIELFAEQMVDAAKAAIEGAEKYLILAAPVGDPYKNGSATTYKPIYEKMQRAFNKHYINIVDYLINYGLKDAGISATSTDQSDISNYRVPTSLVNGRPHLNNTGYRLVAEQVYKRGQLLGYWT